MAEPRGGFFSYMGNASMRFANTAWTYTKKLTAAIYGAIVMLAAQLIKKLFTLAISLLVMAIIIPSILIISIAIGFIKGQQTNFLSGLATGFLSAVGMYTATAMIAGAAIGLYAWSNARSFFESPIKGATLGWNDGFSAVNNAFLQGFTWNIPINFDHRTNNFHSRPWNQHFANDVMNQFHDFHRNVVQGTMTEEQINTLELSTHACAEFQIQDLLTDEELTEIEHANEHNTNQSEKAAIIETISSFKNMKQRLEHDVCSVLLSRPAREDTIVLIKQYQDQSQWRAVPNSSKIFDKDTFKQGCRFSALHPETRESLLTPPSYLKNGVECQTRYRFHAYYPEETSATGVISQELHEHQQALHNYSVSLATRQRHVSEEERPEAIPFARHPSNAQTPGNDHTFFAATDREALRQARLAIRQPASETPTEVPSL